MQHESLVEEIKMCDAVGVEIDEVTDVSNKIQLVCHLRLVKDCTFKTVFAKTVDIASKTGEAIFDAFRQRIVEGVSHWQEPHTPQNTNHTHATHTHTCLTCFQKRALLTEALVLTSKS